MGIRHAAERDLPRIVEIYNMPDLNKTFAEMTALGRVGVPDDIGPMIARLLGEENRWINAQRIEVSGGQAI